MELEHQTAAIVWRWIQPGVTSCEQWDGTNWTEVADLNTARRRLMNGTGNQTSALLIGRLVTTQTYVTETWNGSAWTEVNNLNTARSIYQELVVQHSSCFFGGGSHLYNGTNVEQWDGSSWTEVNDLNTARGQELAQEMDIYKGICLLEEIYSKSKHRILEWNVLDRNK